MARYAIRPFGGPQYERNRDRVREPDEPCGICGRPVNVETAHWGVVIDGGATWGDETSDEKDPGYMGSFPIGPDCHRKHALPET